MPMVESMSFLCVVFLSIKRKEKKKKTDNFMKDHTSIKKKDEDNSSYDRADKGQSQLTIS